MWGKVGTERVREGGERGIQATFVFVVWRGTVLTFEILVSPLDLLKNPMILIAVVGLGFVVGMPYLMDSSMFHPPFPAACSDFPRWISTADVVACAVVDPEMKKEFEEQQKKSILSGGASTANPLQNFDMAGWIAAKTSGQSAETGDEGSGRDVRRRG